MLSGWGKRGLIAAAICAALAAGCGSDDSDDSGDSGGSAQIDGTPPGELALLVPEGAFSQIAEVDFARARSALGLPATFDPRGGLEASGAERRFAEAVLPTTPFYVGPQPIPIAEVLDGGLIQSAAAEGEGGASEVILVRTSQPFEQIADGLVKAGYKRRARILNYTGNADINSIRYPEVVAADGDDGLIAISGEPTRGLAALDAGPAAPDARPELALLGQLPDAPVRVADAHVIGAGCASIGVADQLADGAAELLVVVEGEDASEDALLLSKPGLELGELDVSDDRITATITYPLDAEGSAAEAVTGGFGSDTYECEQDILAPGTETAEP